MSEIGRKVIEGNALPILTNLTKPTINEPLVSILYLEFEILIQHPYVLLNLNELKYYILRKLVKYISAVAVIFDALLVILNKFVIVNLFL